MGWDLLSDLYHSGITLQWGKRQGGFVSSGLPIGDKLRRAPTQAARAEERGKNAAKNPADLHAEGNARGGASASEQSSTRRPCRGRRRRDGGAKMASPAQAAPSRVSSRAVAESERPPRATRSGRGSALTSGAAAPRTRKAAQGGQRSGGAGAAAAWGEARPRGKERSGTKGKRRRGSKAAQGKTRRLGRKGERLWALLLRALGILGVKVSSDSFRYPAPFFPMGVFGDGFPAVQRIPPRRAARHQETSAGALRTDRQGLRGEAAGRERARPQAGGAKRARIRFAARWARAGGTAGNGGGGRIGRRVGRSRRAEHSPAPRAALLRA